MFTTYIKSLNDMVFSTSDDPEEPSNTGVLGRIGNWFSPWKGKGPKSPAENGPQIQDQAVKTGGEEKCEEPVRAVASAQKWEKKEQSFDPNRLGLSKDIFPRKEEDATESARRGCREPEEGGPKEEGSGKYKKKRGGQGKEASRVASVSGNCEKNASSLTNLSPSSEQGVACNPDQDHTQPHAQKQARAQTGKTLHVYLEETSVTNFGQNTCTGQAVVRTKVSEHLQVSPKAKLQQGFDSSKSSSSTAAQNKSPKLLPSAESQIYDRGPEEATQKSVKDWQLKTEPDKDYKDSMGRKKKYRKNGQADGESSSREQAPCDAQLPDEFSTSDNPVASPEGNSLKSLKGEQSSINSPSNDNPTSLTSPGGGERQNSCPQSNNPADNIQDGNSVTSDTRACVAAQGADKEDSTTFYKVERKTETPESKRRSIKVSHSEVKLFPKCVPLKPEQSSKGENEELNASQKDNMEASKKTKTEADLKLHDLKETEEEPKAAIGRIADRINLFECQAVRSQMKTLQTPRSADVSPARNASGRLKKDAFLSEQRSRSAEGHRSISASPSQGISVNIKERVKNFAGESVPDSKAALPQKSTMLGITKKSTTSSTGTASKTLEQDNQGKLDTEEQKQTAAAPKITLKKDGKDTAAREVGVSTVENNQLRKPGDKTDCTVKGTVDSSELTNTVSPQSQDANRTGSRPKRRKSKEPTSPSNHNNKAKSEPFETKGAVQQQMEGTRSLASKKKEKQDVSDTRQIELNQDLVAVDSQNMQAESSFEEGVISKPVNRQEVLPEPSLGNDGPDPTPTSIRTKTSIDKAAITLPQNEVIAGENNLSFKQEMENCAKNSSELPLPSPGQPVEASSGAENAMVIGPSVDKELQKQPESKTKLEAVSSKAKETKQTERTPNKGPEIIGPIVDKGFGNLEKPENVNKKDTQKRGKENPQQRSLLEKNTVTDDDALGGHYGISKKEEIVARDPSRKEETQSLSEQIKTEANHPELVTESSGPLTQSQHVSVTPTKLPEESVICAVTKSNNAWSGSESHKGSSKGEKATNQPKLQTKFPESPGTRIIPVIIAAEPTAECVSEQNKVTDSPTDGVNGSISKAINAAATLVEETTLKSSHDPPLTTVQADNAASLKEHTPASTSKFGNNKGTGEGGDNKRSIDESLASDVKSGDTMNPAPRCLKLGESQNTSDSTVLKGKEKISLSASDSAGLCSSVNVIEKTDEKQYGSQSTEPSSAAEEDIISGRQLDKVKNENFEIKPHQTVTDTTSLKANMLIPVSFTDSSRKKLHKPRGLSKDDLATHQDVPSSWLDLDFPKQRLKVSGPKLSSSVSESNLLDTSNELDDENFVEKIKRLCAPFSHPPRKHNHLRPPQPPFAMPAIKEDHFEKTFDPEEFKFGLRRKKQFSLDASPSIIAKLQRTETKSGQKPARASLADRYKLLSSLDTHSHLKDRTSVKDEEDVKEEKEDDIKVTSRLEGSSVISSLTNSSFRGSRNDVQAQSESTNTGDALPCASSQRSPPTPSEALRLSATAKVKDNLTKQGMPSAAEDEAQAAKAVVSDSGPPLPSFNDIKLPDYFEKYLPREAVQSTQGQDMPQKKIIGKPPGSTEEAPQGARLCDSLVPCLPGMPPATCQTPLEEPLAPPQRILNNNIRAAKGFHKRPGKILLFEKAQFTGQTYETYRDVVDATSLQFSPLISVMVIRGCWILYESPGFQGRSIALEEGGSELTNVWAESQQETDAPMVIGSIRLAVSDYNIPHIDLFTEPEGHGRVTPYHDDTIETGSFGIPLSTASIQVHSGFWLVFSDPGFQGMLAVLEPGIYPFPEAWGFSSPYIGSLRPLKMGGFKVENPTEVKAVVYEKPGFEGCCLETDSEIFSFGESERHSLPDEGICDSNKLTSVGSLKIIGGLWVGYSQPGFEGQQHILEEGEYADCGDWGGSDQLLSLRPILVDFMSPHLKMFSEKDFGQLGKDLDLTVPVINMEDTGYGMKTQSVEVISGVWVVFEEPGFCGESYILAKGLYGCPEDWGALQPKIASVMPVVLDDFEHMARFKVQLFSDPDFQGSSFALENNMASLQEGFSVGSCKVLSGSWLAFEGQDFTGRMYLLEEGKYADLSAMGFVSDTSSILSLQPVGFEFSLPSITLFERRGLQGRRVVLIDASVNLKQTGCGRVQSLLVEGGMWILYEGINYRGAQILLKPGEVPDWHQLSKWNKIGSLRPLMQKKVHFRLRNRQTGLMMSVVGDLEEVKLLRIQEAEETDGFEQIWFYNSGHLCCKLLDGYPLGPSGSVILSGSRVGLIPANDNKHTHTWSITPEGFIRYMPSPDLVLEVKGGHHYDKNLVILNTPDPEKLHQRWNVEII